MASNIVNPSRVVLPAITLSGANVNFAIPTSVRSIILVVANLSSTGTNSIGVQLSTAATFATTGYLASADLLAVTSAPANTTAAFVIVPAPSAASIVHATCQLTLIDPSTWVFTQSGGGSNAAYSVFGNGSRNMGASIDGLRLLAFGGDTLDGGTAQLTYIY
jgi:hypothetical protein